jgi:hypothetical protein
MPKSDPTDFDYKMMLCEAGWRRTEDPVFIIEACEIAWEQQQVMPEWLVKAIYILAMGRRTKAHMKAARAATAHVMRYLTVRDAHELEGLSWERAKERAAEIMADVSAETCYRSYKAVARDVRANRGGLYVTASGRGRMYVLPPKKQKRKR